MTDEEMERMLRDAGVPEDKWSGAKETMKLGFVPTQCEVVRVHGAPDLVTIVFERISLEE